jgi:type II secretory pathway component PulJ
MNKKIGTTLIELVVISALVATLSLLMAALIAKSLESYRLSRQTIELQDNAALAIKDFETITRGATEIETSNADELAFYTYLVGDNYPAPSLVRYYIDGDELLRSVISPVGEGPTFTYPEENELISKIIRHILNTDSIFAYYNEASGEIAAPVPADAVRMIRITVNVGFANVATPTDITETTVVSLRNLKNNL